MLANQHTIKTSASISGIGLHTGKQCTLTLVPAPASYGIKFVRTDLENCPEIPAHIDHVIDVTRGTVLRTNGATVHTVEHVLSALMGMQIDNVRVELTAEEAPVLDGSSKPYVDLIKQVGCVEQSEPKRYLEITDTITYHDAEHGIDIIAVPSDRFRITYMIDYDTPMLGTQYTSLYDMQAEFESDFAPARTFCLLSEIKTLLDGNLIKGGRIDNAVVFIDGKLTADELTYIKDKMHITEDITVPETGIFGGGEMRFPNEPVRHKVMDLIGDLALLGAPIKGHVLVARGGHSSHVELVRLLHKDWQRQQLQEKYQRKATEDFIFDINAIKKILPHRYPFLLVDRILELVPGEWVTGIKNVTVGDHFFQGHFPDYPIMPGVLIVEAMGQVGGVLLLNMESQPAEKLVYFTGFDKVKFRHPVRPGDQLYFRVEMTYFRRGICRMKGRAFVGEKLAAEAEMQAVMVDKEK